MTPAASGEGMTSCPPPIPGRIPVPVRNTGRYPDCSRSAGIGQTAHGGPTNNNPEVGVPCQGLRRSTPRPRWQSTSSQSLTWDTHLRVVVRSEEHTSELQSHSDLVCRLLLEK